MEEKPKWLYEGIIIAFLTALSYIYAYTYEASFAKVFRIPSDIIELNLTIIIAAAISIVTSFLFLMMFFDLTVERFPNIPSALFSKFMMMLAPILICLAHIYTYGFQKWERLIGLFIVTLILFFFTFINPLLIYRDKKTYMERLIASVEDIQTRKAITDFFDIPRHFLRKFGLVVFFSFLGYLLASSLGTYSAVKKKEFLTIDSSDLVVLKIYGDKAICAPFSRDTKEVQAKFIIKNLAESSTVIFNHEKIGPLHIKEDETK